MIDILNIPEKAKTNIFIPKKHILNSNTIGKDSKKYIKEHVNSIYLIGEINENTFNVFPYKSKTYNYETILILSINLKSFELIDKLSRIFQELFPDPAIILFYNSSRFSISTAIKRKNKLDDNKIVIETINQTRILYKNKVNPILKHMDLNKNIFSNIKEYYLYFDKIVYLDKYSDVLGNLIFSKFDNKTFELLHKLELEKQELEILNKKFNLSRMESKKMKYFILIREKKDEIEEIISQIKGCYDEEN